MALYLSFAALTCLFSSHSLPPSLPSSLPLKALLRFTAFALPEITASVTQFGRQNQVIIDCFPSSEFGAIKTPLVVQNDLVSELGRSVSKI